MADKKVKGIVANGKPFTIGGKSVSKVIIVGGDTYILETIETKTITYIANGSTYTTRSIAKGSELTMYNIPNEPVREDWTFIGWYKGSTKLTVGTVITEDITVTAKWEQEKQTGVETLTCKDCHGVGQIETLCPVCDGTGIITNACNNCGIDLGNDWSIDIQPNCPKCSADLTKSGAVNPNVECYGACGGTGSIFEDCYCGDGMQEYPVYETIQEIY